MESRNLELGTVSRGTNIGIPGMTEKSTPIHLPPPPQPPPHPHTQTQRQKGNKLSKYKIFVLTFDQYNCFIFYF